MSTARSRLALVLLPAVVTLVVILLAFSNARLYTRDIGWVDHTRQVIERSNTLLIEVLSAEVGQRGYLVTGDSAFLGPVLDAKLNAEKVVTELQRLTSDNPSQRPRLAAVDSELAAGFAIIDRGAVLRARGRIEPAAHGALLREARTHIDRLRRLVDALQGEEQRLLALRESSTARQAMIASSVLLLGGALAVIVAMLVNLLLARIIDERERMSRELVAQLDDLAAVRRELDARAGGGR